jgi:hypothetical protein
MVVKQPTKLSLTLLAQLLDVETVICGQDYTSASTNMEYTTTFEMGCRLAVDWLTVTSTGFADHWKWKLVTIMAQRMIFSTQ